MLMLICLTDFNSYTSVQGTTIFENSAVTAHKKHTENIPSTPHNSISYEKFLPTSLPISLRTFTYFKPVFSFHNLRKHCPEGIQVN